MEEIRQGILYLLYATLNQDEQVNTNISEISKDLVKMLLDSLEEGLYPRQEKTDRMLSILIDCYERMEPYELWFASIYDAFDMLDPQQLLKLALRIEILAKARENERLGRE